MTTVLQVELSLSSVAEQTFLQQWKMGFSTDIY